LIPADLHLPKKYTQWRTDQAETVEKIVHSGKKFFLLDSPTGAGKSLSAIAAYKRLLPVDQALDRMLGEEEKYRCIYLTRTIQLQNQVLQDFPAKMVKGRSNYPCGRREKDFPNFTAADCPGNCGGAGNMLGSHSCPYKWAKATAVKAPLAVLNDSYYLSEVNGPGQFSDANMVVVDEVDGIEGSLMSFIEFTVSERQCKRYGLEPPEKMDSLVEWQTWARGAYGRVEATIESMGSQLPLAWESWGPGQDGLCKEIKQGQTFMNQMRLFINEVNDTWILDLEPKSQAGWRVIFKPVTVGPYCEKYLWRHGKRFLGMSGTILDPEILAQDLGIRDYDYQRLDSHFP
ncbi:MAG: hypothetical protein Q8P12_01190, partial [bacterium]|nr:hypothetical protein [bacterium]